MSTETTDTDTDTAAFEATVGLAPFEQFLAAPNAIVDEFALRVDDEGFHTVATDPANVAIVEAHLETDAFEHIDGEAACGIRCTRLASLLDRELGTDEIRMAWDGDRRVLDVRMGSFSYELATIDPASLRDEPDIPTLDLPCVVEIDGDRLTTAIEYFREFGTHVDVSFDADARRFTMEALEKHGTSVGTDEGAFEVDAADLAGHVAAGDASSFFSLDYFDDIVQAVPDTAVAMDLGEQFPMKLRYDIGPNGLEKHGAVTFMQAPRIQE